MAKAYAYAAFDIDAINFYNINSASTFTMKKSEFAAHYDSGYEEYFYGKNLTYDKNGYLTGGVITGYEAVYGGTVFYIGGIKVSATAVESAIDSTSTKDDMKLMATFFKGADTLTGSDQDDNLKSYGGADTLTGGLGDDHMAGGRGHDVFVFAKNSGSDEISDFEAKNSDSSHDRIDLSGYRGVDSFSDVKSLMTQSGDDVIIDLGKDAITLDDVKLGQLDKHDFIF